MLRRLRFAFRPGWLALHALAAALITTMILLGRWQLTVSERKHFNLQNFGYAIQWWAFSAFVLAMWARALRDASRRQSEPSTRAEAPPQKIAYRRYVMPQLSSEPADTVDEVHAAYNDFLSRMAADDAQKRP